MVMLKESVRSPTIDTYRCLLDWRLWVLAGLLLLLVLLVPGPAGDASAIDWEEEHLFSPMGEASMPRLLQVDGRLYLFWVEYGFNNDTLWFRWNDGDSWTAPAPVVTMRADYTAIGYDVDGDEGVIHLVFQTKEAEDRDVHYMYYNGTWSSDVLLTVEKRVSNQTNPSLAVLGSQVTVAFQDDNPLDPGIYYRRFDGRTWTAEKELTTDLAGDARARFPRVAISGKDVMVLWESEVAIRLVTYNGEVWSKVTSVVTDHGFDAYSHPKLIAGTWGASVLYTEWVEGEHLLNLTTNLGTGWSPPETVHMTPIHTNPGPDISYERGNLVLAYTNMDERVTFQRYDGKDWSLIGVLNQTSDMGQWVPDVLLSNGTAHVVFRYSIPTRGDLKYFRGAIEVAPPSSTVTYDGPYWVGPGVVDLAWSLSDDFGITAIALEYRHGTDNATWSDWIQFAFEDDLSGPDASSNVNFGRPDGDGFYQFRSVATDVWGNVEPFHVGADAAFGFDTVEPTGGISIDGGSKYTTTTTVTLDLSFEDATSGVYKVRLSNAVFGGDEPWEDPTSTREWELEPGSGERMVIFQVMDTVGLVSEVYSDEIVLDPDLPTGTIAPSGRTTRVNGEEVALDLDFNDATGSVEAIRLSNDGIWDAEEWMTPTPQLNWTVPGGDGEKTIYYQVRDAAGHLSQTYTLTITLDTVAPYVVSTDPEEGDTDVDRNSSLVIMFSEPMNTTSAERAIRIQYLDFDIFDSINGTDFVWSPDKKMVTFKPQFQGYLFVTAYKLVIFNDTAKDLAGNPIATKMEVRFTVTSLVPQNPDDGNGDGDGDDRGLSGLVIALVVIVVVLVVVVAILLLRGKGGK